MNKSCGNSVTVDSAVGFLKLFNDNGRGIRTLYHNNHKDSLMHCKITLHK